MELKRELDGVVVVTPDMLDHLSEAEVVRELFNLIKTRSPTLTEDAWYSYVDRRLESLQTAYASDLAHKQMMNNRISYYSNDFGTVKKSTVAYTLWHKWYKFNPRNWTRDELIKEGNRIFAEMFTEGGDTFESFDPGNELHAEINFENIKGEQL